MNMSSLLAFLAAAACFVSACNCSSCPPLKRGFLNGMDRVLVSERFVFIQDFEKFCQSYETERWVNLTEGDVCFGVPGNEFATAVIPMEGFLLAIKLVHVTGHVSCGKSLNQDKSKWGCPRSHPAYGKTPFNVVITTGKTNSIIYPTELSLRHKRESMWYDIPEVEPDSPELIFGNPSQPHYVASGQELRMWLAEDLMNAGGKGYGGKVCFTAQGWFMH